MAGKSNDNTTKIRCSFCGKTEKQVRKLIAGPGDVFICDECISLCDEILEDELQELYSDRDAEEEVEINLLKPRLKNFLRICNRSGRSKKSIVCSRLQSL